MFSLQLDQLELMRAWQETDAAPCWNVQFPLMSMPEVDSFGAVYFELEPGEELPVHTDSKDEILVILSGSSCEGTVGREVCQASRNGLVFVPAMVPHSFRNSGPDTVRVLGIFAGSAVTSTFEHEIMPLGQRVFDSQDAPART